jgi:hypothetical protein
MNNINNSVLNTKKGFWSNTGSDIVLDNILHMFLLFGFLSCFYGLVILPSTALSLESETKSLINNILVSYENHINKSIDPTQNPEFYKKIKNNSPNVFSYLKGIYGNNTQLQDTNNQYIWIIIVIILFFLFIIIIILYIPYFKYKTNTLNHILYSNILILALITIFEVLFFHFVLSKDTHIDKHEIEEYAIKQFSKKFNKMLDNPDQNLDESIPQISIPILVVIAIMIFFAIGIPVFWINIFPKLINKQKIYIGKIVD